MMMVKTTGLSRTGQLEICERVSCPIDLLQLYVVGSMFKEICFRG